MVGVILIYHDLGVLSLFLFVMVAIWGFGLRDKFTNETTASAYSVFNKGGKAIVGGLTAGQFERQMRGSMPGEARADDPVHGPVAEAKQPQDSSTAKDSRSLSTSEREKRRRATLAAAERRQKGG